jgi:hypothetical protein
MEEKKKMDRPHARAMTREGVAARPSSRRSSLEMIH